MHYPDLITIFFYLKKGCSPVLNLGPLFPNPTPSPLSHASMAIHDSVEGKKKGKMNV